MSVNLTALQKMELDELDGLFEDFGMESDGEAIDSLPTARKRFEIKGLDSLNWAMRKIAALNAAKQEVDSVKKNEIARIDNWYASETKKHNDNIKYFELIISEYADNKRAGDAKYKGESTPYGKVSFGKQQAEWKYPDEDKVIEFLEGKEELKPLVKTVKEITNKSDVKKAFEIMKNVFVRDGEMVEMVMSFTEDGCPEGLQYCGRMVELRDSNGAMHTEGQIYDTSTGEVAEDVAFVEIGVFYKNVLVEGVEVNERPDKIKIVPDVHA
jgi:phage host-nuclease inhibitor protein Gam